MRRFGKAKDNAAECVEISPDWWKGYVRLGTPSDCLLYIYIYIYVYIYREREITFAHHHVDTNECMCVYDMSDR